MQFRLIGLCIMIIPENPCMVIDVDDPNVWFPPRPCNNTFWQSTTL